MFNFLLKYYKDGDKLKLKEKTTTDINIEKSDPSISVHVFLTASQIHHAISSKQYLASYWWDDKPNFGDSIGPYILRRLTGKPILNVRQLKSTPGLMTVGSVIQMINRPGMQIWGSGLIDYNENIKNKLLNNPPECVYATRGLITANILRTDLGLNVPEIYGDPALLCPDIYNIKLDNNASRDTIVCPHRSHRYLFRDLDDVKVIDVASHHEKVVKQIAGARRIISTSLHGLIVAQAYEVPWTWLYIHDKPLTGDAFKFNDFFSTLKDGSISMFRCSAEDVKKINYLDLGEKAKLPKEKFSRKLLKDSFPH